MSARLADTTVNPGTGHTASDADGRSSGNLPTARIKIPVDRLPDAPEPTLPCMGPEEKVSSFALSWSEEQHRRRVDASERQKKWRRKHDGT